MAMLVLPIKNGDFPWRTVSHSQRVTMVYHGYFLPISHGDGWVTAISAAATCSMSASTKKNDRFIPKTCDSTNRSWDCWPMVESSPKKVDETPRIHLNKLSWQEKNWYHQQQSRKLDRFRAFESKKQVAVTINDSRFRQVLSSTNDWRICRQHSEPGFADSIFLFSLCAVWAAHVDLTHGWSSFCERNISWV